LQLYTQPNATARLAHVVNNNLSIGDNVTYNIPALNLTHPLYLFANCLSAVTVFTSQAAYTAYVS